MKPDIGSESWFLPNPPAFNAPVRGVPVGISPSHLVWKTRMVRLPDGENFLKIWVFVWTWSTNVTDRRTDTAWRHRPRSCIASRGCCCCCCYCYYYYYYMEAFSSDICLSGSCACDSTSSSFSLFCCSRLEIRALHFLFSRIFCSSQFTSQSLCFVLSGALSHNSIHLWANVYIFKNLHSCILNSIEHHSPCVKVLDAHQYFRCLI